MATWPESFADTNGGRITRALKLYGGVRIATLAGAETWTGKNAHFNYLDPGGSARVITLPADDTGSREGAGLWYIVTNTADADGENITFQDDASSSVVVLNRGECGILACDGSGWSGVVLSSDSGLAISVDTISEFTSANGVAIDGLSIKDATIKPLAGGTAFIDLTLAATGEADIILADNLASALQIREAANVYETWVTTNGAELKSLAVDQQRTATARDLSYHLKSEIMDDMYGRADTEAENSPQWVLNSGSDPQALDPALDTTQAGGVFQVVAGDGDGTTAVDGSQMVWTGVPVQLDSTGGVTVVEARVRIKTSIANVAVNFGLTDATGLEEPFSIAGTTITATATDACCFVYDTDATTDEWFGCAVDTNTDDTGNATTGVAPVADTWQILRMEISADGATINFFIDNAATADLALSGAAGVGPDVVLYPTIIACGDNANTVAKTVDVDWVRVETIR